MGNNGFTQPDVEYADKTLAALSKNKGWLGDYPWGHDWNIIDSQYLRGCPCEIYYNMKMMFPDTVDLAISYGYGNWHGFTTNGSCMIDELPGNSCEPTVRFEELVDTTDGAPAGLGTGFSRHRKIFACEVIPTPSDVYCPSQTLDNIWRDLFPLFDGLHTILGYRTPASLTPAKQD
ncbi:hypothetical protein BU26DRAFT_608631 [Trematosphaeria pertusa]|uniref:Uncharacterized protein n=1 Tax=Trematosphaeria pertusa TaxID=390896 RepID=A0A6A6I0Z0_9PLEO|nr:uncharacterized protein BU26DRAFT_608631 [Trematosphaeria pertusa]KAF2244164.1 hypothetical protein BU26DRAFT_608631 [Trematosphaeria pertusa]